MQTRLQLLHTWQRQLAAILVGERTTRVRGLAVLALGMLMSGTVILAKIGAELPLVVRDESRTKRFRRWLANAKVDVGRMWSPLRRTLLADWAGNDLLLVFDPTPQAGHATVLVLGVVQHKRVLPLSWRVVPQREPWAHPLATYLKAMIAKVAADLPSGCQVTMLADRGLTGPEVIACCRSAGWHLTFRLNAGASQTHRVRIDGTEYGLWAWLEGQRFSWTGPVELFKKSGWIAVELTTIWDHHYAEPWILISDQPAGRERVREYRRRIRIEATFADTKKRGFDLERTKIVKRDRIERLLLALSLALWWGTQLGLRVIRTGVRCQFDRHDRRDLSVVRLGRRALADRLANDSCPPLPFTRRDGSWHYARYV